MGSTDAPTPANAWLVEWVDHHCFPINLKSPTLKVFFHLYPIVCVGSGVPGYGRSVSFCSLHPSVPSTPCGWHRRSCRCFSRCRRFISYLQIRAHSVSWESARTADRAAPAGRGPVGSAYVLIAAFVTLFPLGPVDWSKKLVKYSHPCLLDLSFQENKNLTEAWKIVPFVWDKPPTSLFACKRFPVCEN